MNAYEMLKPWLFRLEAETAHHLALRGLELAPETCLRAVFGGPPMAERDVGGIRLRNPVGLAAGMDKNAVALPAWEALGFGFVEIGTITALAQPGNPQPRLFRYPQLGALINRMGFNNDGADAVAARLARLKGSGRWPGIPVGVNLGKSKATPLEEAAADYLHSFRTLLPYGDYFVLNVSSPNTPGLRELQEKDALAGIVRALRGHDAAKPILVKIAPDLTEPQLDAILELAVEEAISGLIATNTTLDHSAMPAGRDEAGGLSGGPLRARALDVLRRLRAGTRIPIIASGGIMDAAAARERIEAGADLVQIYTGFVYRGPTLIREIVEELKRMESA
ncbi:MAG: quinone-dependent dihydroorotate dehydrogenase [Terrimicrobiaceae bacterium]|nr:quinone-dependent dihydroorotate dehydrogenase [Terrimicrobiaceae bacterium]